MGPSRHPTGSSLAATTSDAARAGIAFFDSAVLTEPRYRVVVAVVHAVRPRDARP
jgi:hypothetical protein